MGYVSLFAKQMTNDRGLIAVAAIIFAKGNPTATAVVAVLFGLSTALSIRLPDVTGIAPQLLETLPYLVTVLALVILGVRTAKNRSRHGSWNFDPS